MSVGLLACMSGRGATTRQLLSSMSQPVRDLGGQILRQSFVPPPRATWEPLMARLKLGMKESAVDELLIPAIGTNDPAGSTTNEILKSYRLDDLWVMHCWFTNSLPAKSERALSEAKLVEEMDRILVEPPAGFTGEWRTYWMNGQIDFDSHYLNGELDGLITTFYSDGSVFDVANCRYGVLDGEATAYYLSGHILCKGQYRDGVQVGRWVWYKDDGKVESERDFDKEGPVKSVK